MVYNQTDIHYTISHSLEDCIRLAKLFTSILSSLLVLSLSLLVKMSTNGVASNGVKPLKRAEEAKDVR